MSNYIKYILAIVIFFLGTIWFIWSFNRLISSSPNSLDGQIFKISGGEGVSEIVKKLDEGGFISSTAIFKGYVYIFGYYSKLKPGIYKISRNMNIIDLVNVFINGSSDTEVTIFPGMTMKEADEALKKAGVLDNELIEGLRPDNFVSDYPFLSGAKDFEGFLMPDTYRFRLGSKVSEVVKIILDNFNKKAGESLKGQNILEVVTLASLVEKEVIGSDDKAIVAGIIENRISKKMPLQIDATIVYWICGRGYLNCDGIKASDYKKDFEYNTYTNRGLPPGPISNPTIESIEAVLHPIKSSYFYYLSDPKTKKTIFSKTFDEHNENRSKYLGL